MKHKLFNLCLALMLMVVLVTGLQIIRKSDLHQGKSESVADPLVLTTDEEPVNQRKLIGILEIKDGDMLERDIIPQLGLIFELTEQDIKEVMASPLVSYLIQDGLTDFRRLEGIIPPGRYEILEGETLVAWSKRVVEVAENRYADLLIRAGQINSLNPDEQVILASIVEAECLANKHYTETAAVFLNRLADQNALQSCVTVEYAMGYQRAFLYGEDVEIDNPYNTYVVNGLPAGPICCMDDESLMAAMQPSTDPSLYYFHYDYLLNEMFFYADYTTFNQEAVASRDRFAANPPVGMREKINKQNLFGFRVQ